MRHDGRTAKDLRKINIETDYMKHAEGSCLIEIGNTKVICTASVDNGVPPFLKGQGTGWITSEYGMLPRSCQKRVPRESTRMKKNGRTYEIQRLIGRSLRSVVDMTAIGERTIWIDCDVMQADGGTRCASITGSFVALCMALNALKSTKGLDKIPVSNHVAAISVGIVDGKILTDLDYEEDSRAEVDMNVVMTDSGKYIEIQGTAEKAPFSKDQMEKMLNSSEKGIKALIKKQKEVLKGILK